MAELKWEQGEREYYQALGKRLRQQRLLLGFTQAQLASRANVSRSAVSQYENGAQRPSAWDLCKVLRALACGSFDVLWQKS